MSHLEPDVLEVLAQGKPPQADLAAHLEACAQCRQQLKVTRGRQRLLAGVKPYTLSEVAFRRVEARLDEAVANGQAQPARPWLWWSLAGLALALVLYVFLPGERTPPSTLLLATPQVAPANAPFSPLTVLSAEAGTQARSGDQPWRPVAAGDVLTEGQALSSKHLVLAPEADVGWALEAEGSLSLGGAASLTVGAGEIVARVSSPIEVLAASRRILSADALFAVLRVGSEVVLHVAQGQVEVLDTVTAERRAVKAPLALRWSDGSRLNEGRRAPLRPLAAPPVPAKPWARFDARGLLSGTEVALDGVRVGVAPFVELVASGRHRLGLTPPGGALRESWADLIGGQPYTAKLEVPLPAAEERAPAAEALGRVMNALRLQKPKLAACYEKWLKANRSAEGEVVLALVVSAQGRVKKATVENASGISGASAECLVTTAKSLVLPPLGAEATLEVPLLLRQPGR